MYLIFGGQLGEMEAAEEKGCAAIQVNVCSLCRRPRPRHDHNHHQLQWQKQEQQ